MKPHGLAVQLVRIVDFMVTVRIGPVGSIDTDECGYICTADRHGRNGSGIIVSQSYLLCRPQFKSQTARKKHRAEYIKFHKSLGADQRRIHSQIYGVSPGEDLVTEWINLAVSVNICGRGIGRRCLVTAQQGRRFGDVDHATAIACVVGIQNLQQRLVIDWRRIVQIDAH